ncbi:membrane protein [Pontibacillus halophilus JSM 076056 = DSM 19796]|uniref:Membrane protein n=1 Tax=Pontibacillus halophilus JSM 076056 = DSM 19796 TaxID=1385510 RepID=A0A0A5IA34_9BACI|nr:membrane protein [Pontibacillus halophilus JSM 076056 = DSM 19796]
MDLETLQSLLIIIGIDIVLGGDNAIVIALASRNLPKPQRNKAILWGTGLAIGIRVVLTAVALYLLQIPFLRFIGGILLIYIAIKLVTDKGEDPDIEAGESLSAAIKTIVFADLVMGFDNVLAIAGASNDNIWLVIIGLAVSVPIIIWGSKLILKLLEKYPVLVYIGAAILAYTAAEMILNEGRFQTFYENNEYLHWVIPIGIIGLVLLLGYMFNRRRQVAT